MSGLATRLSEVLGGGDWRKRYSSHRGHSIKEEPEHSLQKQKHRPKAYD